MHSSIDNEVGTGNISEAESDLINQGEVNFVLSR
jgi:hypothetical protein